MKYKVLCMQEVSLFPEVLDSVREVADVKTLPPDPEVLLQEIVDCDAYIASLHVPVKAEAIAAAKHLRVIATPTTGLDHLDINAMREHGINLICLKEEVDFLSNITCTAEMAWALLLAVVRKLPWSFDAAKRGIWARDKFRGHQLSGKTLGILGYGRLGRIIADIGKGFRMRVLAHDVRDVTPADGVEMVNFDTLLRESDVLSIHIHLTPENTNLIDSAAFAKMKSDAIILNTSRGAIINEADLIDALENGCIGGAGLDVICGEWNDDLTKHPLIRYANTHDNMVVSPHTGGVTFEAQAMTMRFIADKLADYLRTLSLEVSK